MGKKDTLGWVVKESVDPVTGKKTLTTSSPPPWADPIDTLAIMDASQENVRGLDRKIKASAVKGDFKSAWKTYAILFVNWYRDNISPWSRARHKTYQEALHHQELIKRWRDSFVAEGGEKLSLAMPILAKAKQMAGKIPGWLKWALVVSGGVAIGWYVTRKLDRYFPPRSQKKRVSEPVEETE